MRRLRGRTVAYFAFGAFCVLSAARDVLSETLFKDQAYNASPIFVLFVYCVITQLVAGAVLLFTRPVQALPGSVSSTAQVIWLNGFTLAAFLFYFLAIDSPIGAAVNSFVDYGSGPVFTAVVGVLLAGERLDLTFAICAVLSVGGIVVLGLPRVTITEFNLLWIGGLALSLLSSLSSAFYRAYFKLLLTAGMTKSAVIFARLFGLTIVLGSVLLIKPHLFRSDLLINTCVLGLIGFTLPLFLTLTIIERLTIRSFAVLLFALPAITFFLSAVLGYDRLFPSDVVAGALTLAGVAVHEHRTSDKE
jgi:drug/metabolite transporter (DMT)-like permease